MKLAVNTAKLLRTVPLPDEIATVHDAAVVVDLGSGCLKAGFSGDDAPRVTVPTIEGTPSRDRKGMDRDMKDSYVCSQAYKLREKLDLKHPIKRGLVQHWGDPLDLKDRAEGPVERILRHVYEDLLKVSLTDPNQPLLLTEAALTDLTPAKENREKLCEVIFEGLNIPSMYVAQSPVLSLYSTGRTTGTVIEAGYGTCHTSPIFEGYPLFHSILQLDFGGTDLTTMVEKMLAASGTTFNPHHSYYICEYLKEYLCTVAEDKAAYEQAVADKENTVGHQLPDGTEVVLGSQRWSVAESLLDPALLGKEGQRGVHQLAVESIRKCDNDIAPTLYQNVVLAGGSTMFKGLPDRIQHEVAELAPAEKVRIFAATERKQAAWIGGSILASLPTFQDLWVTRAEYDEYGTSHPGQSKSWIIHRNCF